MSIQQTSSARCLNIRFNQLSLDPNITIWHAEAFRVRQPYLTVWVVEVWNKQT